MAAMHKVFAKRIRKDGTHSKILILLATFLFEADARRYEADIFHRNPSWYVFVKDTDQQCHQGERKVKP
jgi:hypothetical protein